MALLFNIDYIDSVSQNHSVFLSTLWYMANNSPIPPSNVSKKFNKSKAVGYSFLINPLPVLNDKLTDPIYIMQYIRLAARRDYALYKLYKITYLDLSFYPDLDITKIKHNPLLSIAGNKLYFKYEGN